VEYPPRRGRMKASARGLKSLQWGFPESGPGVYLGFLNEGYGVDGVRSHERVFEDFGQVGGFGSGGVTEIVEERS